MHQKLLASALLVLLAMGCKPRQFNGNANAQSVSATSPLPVPGYASQQDFSLFQNAFFDLFQDHNQTLDAYREITTKGSSRGKLDASRPKVLLHVDYHSDLYRNDSHANDRFEGIGNYINSLVADGAVNEVWWIIPDATESEGQRRFFWDKPDSYSDWQFRDGPADQTICVSTKGGLSFGPASMSCSHRKVSFHKRSLRMLEGVSRGTSYEALVPEGQFAGKEVILDWDADFFDYNGLFANEGYGGEPRLYSLSHTVEGVEREFSRWLKALARTKVEPVLVTAAMSPEYATNNLDKIENFFRYQGMHSKLGTDYIFQYAHAVETSRSYRGEGTNTIRGIRTQIYFDIMSADRTMGRSNRIELAKPNPKLNVALLLLMRNHGFNQTQAMQELETIATEQGHAGHINISALARYDDLIDP